MHMKVDSMQYLKSVRYKLKSFSLFIFASHTTEIDRKMKEEKRNIMFVWRNFFAS